MSAMGSDRVEFWALPVRTRYATIQLGPWQYYNMVNENRGKGGFGWTSYGRQEKLG
jgi:hypothetical protein